MNLSTFIRAIPDFPKPGIIFRDIAPLLAHPPALREVVDALQAQLDPQVTHLVAVESRGFLFGAPLAVAAGLPLIPVRKAGKLPGAVLSAPYALEYGEGTLELQQGALPVNARCAIVDDVLATGGTIAGAAKLISLAGASPVQSLFLIELLGLNGRSRLGVPPAVSLLRY